MLMLKRYLRQSLVICVLAMQGIPALAYDEAKVNRYIKEAEYYSKQAENHEREEAYYSRKAQKYFRDAEYYSKHKNDSRARTYMRWGKEAKDKATLHKKRANEARWKAQQRMKWAEDEMKK